LDVTHRPQMTVLRNSHFKPFTDKAMTTENAANYLRNNKQITKKIVPRITCKTTDRMNKRTISEG